MNVISTQLFSTATAILFGFASIATAHADDAARYSEQQIAACMKIEGDVKRLQCYDRLFFEESKTVDSAAFVEAQVQSFGAEQKPNVVKQKVSEVLEIEATISKLGRRARNELFFTLDNGQVWSQVSPRDLDLDEGDTVTISRARFGGYILTSQRGASTRVKRLR